ncbi:MAG: peptide chain release factor N(5)-glutamine methyltransferase [Synergistaceae bacterium]|jgi:release factor glutamine methyltransferase|nr:peptide chain release factor N(5)-glutamine methyltransferase [Synergistaceae bacterium]
MKRGEKGKGGRPPYAFSELGSLQEKKSLGVLRRSLIEGLRTAGIENDTGEADLILIRLFRVSRAEILGHPEKTITEDQRSSALEAVRRRAAGEPLQYILNEAYFWGLPFEVGEGVLIPRPETELLVELALEFLPPSPSSPVFLDWGTGSGCIGIAILQERPGARGFLAEKNPASFFWARRNLTRYGLHPRGLLWHSREPGDIPVERGTLDLVISNPPYIPTGELPSLMREVRDHEPRSALDGGEDGMVFYRTLFRHAPLWLRPGGALLLEIGDGEQAKKLRALPPSSLRLAKEIKDYADIPRCMAWVLEAE